MSSLQYWRCPKGHILGYVKRNGSGIRQLHLCRRAYETPSPDPSPASGEGRMREGEMDVMAVVEGYVMDVECSICGRKRTWVPGAESLERILARVGPDMQVETG